VLPLKIRPKVVTVNHEMDALTVHKVLGDDTRYGIYRELAQATSALSAQDIAERLDLHPNTVRPHLERMRDAEIVVVEALHRGTPGRPQHLYSLAPGAPGIHGFEPPSHTLLAGMLAAVAEHVGADRHDAAAIGRSVGRAAVARNAERAAIEGLPRARDEGCLAHLVGELDRLGFDPSTERHDDLAHVAFLRCPFRELAEAYPELVCNLHRGITEGLVESAGGGMVEEFRTLYDRDHCSVVVSLDQPNDYPAPV
jgi:predicted ArsR family transcriptional regulator